MAWWKRYYFYKLTTMSDIQTEASISAKGTASSTWASILILLRWICLIFCRTIGITNKTSLRHIQGLDWASLQIICSDKHLCYYHRNVVRTFIFIAESLYYISARGHSFSTYVTFSEKLTFLTRWYAHVRVHIRG